VKSAKLERRFEPPDSAWRTFLDQVDPVRHLVGTALVWGGIPEKMPSHSRPQPTSAEAQERLVNELNEAGPVAEVVIEDERAGGKGNLELLGQVGLALLAADALKHIARVIVEFVKRNDRYEIRVGNIKISKDHASERDVERINATLRAIMAQRRGTRGPR